MIPIVKYISNIPNSKASGIDNISVKMIKATLPFIVPIITDMFNRILIDGYFPSAWKHARVTPLFKGGDNSNPSNFRPISVLPILSKVFEKHLNIHIYSHLSKNNILHPYQCGFRKSHSCTDAVHKLISDCLDLKTRGEKICLMFLDFSKAFDCVNHKILYHKLELAGFKNKSLQILQSYFHKRRQKVVMNDKESLTLDINVGVPQGSLIAPVLFLIYINDLLRLIPKGFAYADDTVFVSYHKDVQLLETNCNLIMKIISNWCTANHMTINLQKSHFLLYNTDENLRNSFTLKFNSQSITCRHETKLLGFVLTDRLSWNNHVDTVCSKVTKSLTLLQFCRPYMNSKSAIAFYYQFIFCHIIYGIHIYYNLAPRYVTKDLFLLQKRAFRLIANLHHMPAYIIPTNDLSKSLRLLTLPMLNIYFTSIQCFKIFHGLCPRFLHDNYRFLTHFNLRDMNKLHTITNNHFENVIASCFNNLPPNIRSLSRERHFKHYLSDYLFNFNG